MLRNKLNACCTTLRNISVIVDTVSAISKEGVKEFLKKNWAREKVTMKSHS